MPNDGNVSFADAFANAETEHGLGDPSDGEAALPADKPQVPASAEPAPAAADVTPSDGDGVEGEAISLDGLTDLYKDDKSPEVDVTSDEFLDTQIPIDGPNGIEFVTIRELRQDGLRQADYTRKTQEAAEIKRAAGQAVTFYEEFMADPEKFTRTLAVRSGLINEGAAPVSEFTSLPSAEAVAAQVEEQVQARLADNPDLKQAQYVAAQQAVANTFAQIEADHNVALTTEHRQAVVNEANRQGTANLDLVFRAMLADLRSAQPQRSRKGAAPAAPSGGAAAVAPAAAEESNPTPTIAEAFAIAEAELSRAS